MAIDMNKIRNLLGGLAKEGVRGHLLKRPGVPAHEAGTMKPAATDSTAPDSIAQVAEHVTQQNASSEQQSLLSGKEQAPESRPRGGRGGRFGRRDREGGERRFGGRNRDVRERLGDKFGGRGRRIKPHFQRPDAI